MLKNIITKMITILLLTWTASAFAGDNRDIHLFKFILPDKSASILMPGEPKGIIKDILLPDKTTTITLHLFVYTNIDENESYGISYWDYPQDHIRGRAASEILADKVTTSRTILSNKETTFKGIPGRRVISKDSDGDLFTQLILLNRLRFYEITCISKYGHTAKYSDIFLKSLLINQ